MTKTKQQIKDEIEELQSRLEEIEKKEKLKQENESYQEIKYKNKIFRIYKWENKLFKDFPVPEGFNWCEYFDFVKLINENKIKLEEYPIYYYTKNQFKLNLNNGYGLSRVFLGGNALGVDSGGEYFADSDADGRVVVSKVGK